MTTSTHGNERAGGPDSGSESGTIRRRRLPRSTAALVAGTVVVLALGSTGGAVAGSLITSKQIKNNTITTADIKNKTITNKDLARSALPRTGPKGATGATGARGPAGQAGAQGPAGPITGDLPSGVTQRGTFYLYAPSGPTGGVYSQTGISFGLRIPGELPVTVVKRGETKPPECTGTIYDPTAAPGHMCVYVGLFVGYDRDLVQVFSQSSPEDPDGDSGRVDVIGPAGGMINAPTTGSSGHNMQGVWAVTAP
ncbi:hypothetical protein ACFP8W_02380 [Nocardioides hankookensis]|uniref:Collagen-like protein n=1 Tax=Nocardioides hankookensis TaxID=443157 RepID=A0ABW1LFH7_9ACTN